MLYLTQRRNADREKRTTAVTVYSNIGTPKVYLNGQELSGIRNGYTDVHYVFDNVSLADGKEYFIFLAIFSENGLFFISSRIPVPIVPGTQAHQPVYAGR